MKLPLQQVPPKEHIKAILEQHLPKYQYAFRVGRFVDCQKSFFTGCTIVPKRDGLAINSNFPSYGSSVLFTLFMLFTGILIGLLLWLLIFKGGQNKVRDEVAATLGPILGAPPGSYPQIQIQDNHPQGQMMQGQPQQMMQPPPQQMQPPQMQGFPPGARVLVVAQDGNRYPATIAQAAQGQYLCTMPDGQSYWFPQQSVGPA